MDEIPMQDFNYDGTKFLSIFSRPNNYLFINSYKFAPLNVLKNVVIPAWYNLFIFFIYSIVSSSTS